MKKSPKLGFSLIELSIALLVIGILVAGVTKGSIIITEAKLKSALYLTNNSPVASIPNLVFWVEASDSNNLKTSTVGNIATAKYGNISNGDSISAWNDRNPQLTDKITVVASTDGSRPTYTTSGINNLPSLSFAKASAQKLSSGTTPIKDSDPDYTLIAVFKPTSLSSNSYVVSQSPNTAVNGRQGSIFLTATNLVMGGFNNDYAAGTVTVNNSYIAVARINNAQPNNVTIYSNGTSSVGAVGSPSTLNIGAEILLIGARTTGALPFQGLISEVIIYSRALTTNEIRHINSYLSTKYGIKLS